MQTVSLLASASLTSLCPLRPVYIPPAQHLQLCLMGSSPFTGQKGQVLWTKLAEIPALGW